MPVLKLRPIESLELDNLHKQALMLGFEKGAELNHLDLRVLTPDEVYEGLSEDTKKFFDEYPIQSTSDKRLRVSRVLASWIHYMDEYAEKSEEIKLFEYQESYEENKEKWQQQLQAEQTRVTEFAKTPASMCQGHEKIFERHAKINEIKQERKKARMAEKDKKAIQAEKPTASQASNQSDMMVDYGEDSGAY